MQEYRSSKAAAHQPSCTDLINESQKCAEAIIKHTIKSAHNIAEIMLQLDQIAELIDYLTQLKEVAQNTVDPSHYLNIVKRRQRFCSSQLIAISKLISQESFVANSEELTAKEQIYLRIIKLFERLNMYESAAITFATLIKIYKSFLINNPRYKTEEHVTTLFRYTCSAIELAQSRKIDIPRDLHITDVFEMYAFFIHRAAPIKARGIFFEAIDYSQRGYYHNPYSHFFCLKGIASCYIKLLDVCHGYITPENSNFEIDACYQLAISYYSKALEYRELHKLDNTDIADCLHMLCTANHQLGIHYEHLYKMSLDSSILPHIEGWYRQALFWAKQSGETRKEGAIYNQLAHFYQLHGNYNHAIICWQNAIENLFMDLEKRKPVPIRLPAMITAYQQFTRALNPRNQEYYFFYSQLVKDLIALGHEVKDQETHHFFQAATTAPQITNSHARHDYKRKYY